MTSLLLAATAAIVCPTLAGDYLCLTSFSTKSEPWSLTQSQDARGHDVYTFEKKDYIADGISRLDRSVSYSLSIRATCSAASSIGTSTQLLIEEIGDLDDRGRPVHFENQNVLEMNAKSQLISRYSHNGALIDTMVCTRR